MSTLPWDLWLVPENLPSGLDCAFRYDAAVGTLSITLANTTSAPIAPRDVRLAADCDTPAADGWLWIHGRYMQMDALVRNFGAPAPEGYDGRFARPSDDGVTYILSLIHI